MNIVLGGQKNYNNYQSCPIYMYFNTIIIIILKTYSVVYSYYQLQSCSESHSHSLVMGTCPLVIVIVLMTQVYTSEHEDPVY